MARRRRYRFLMPAMEHDLLRRVDDGVRAWLTPVARQLLWAPGVAGLVVLGTLARPVVLIVSFWFALLVASVLVGLAFRPRLALTRLLPPPACAGSTYEYRVLLENTARRPARCVTVQERELPAELRPSGEPGVVEVLAPGARAELTLRLSCLRRGAYVLPWLQGASSFPSGLVKWSRSTRRPQRLLVYPRMRPLPPLRMPMSRHHHPEGISLASRVGDSTEFFGTREWRQGDRLRDVHWPSTARRGRLVVKEYQDEYFVRLALVIDSEARTARAEDRLEVSLELAASLAAELTRQDYVLDLVTVGEEVHRIESGRALAQLDSVLELLACVEPCDRFDPLALEAALLPEARQLSGIIFVCGAWTPERAALVQRFREQRVVVRVLMPPPSPRPPEISEEEWVVTG